MQTTQPAAHPAETPLRRYLRARRLRVDWLAEQTGLKPKRLYNLSAGLARWTQSEADRVTRILAAASRDDTADLYHELFDGVDVRPSLVATPTPGEHEE